MPERVLKLSRATLLIVGALSLGGCQGAIWGNMAVLGVTVGIFFGTLALGRAAPPSSAEASTSSGGTRSR